MVLLRPMSILSAPTSRARRGAAVVEFALAAPIIFLFLLGIVEVGRGFMVVHLLNNAVREGCRTGVVAGTPSATIKQVVSDRLSSQGISGATVHVLVNGAETEAANAQSSDKITVDATIPVADFTWLPGGQYLSGALGGTYSLRRE